MTHQDYFHSNKNKRCILQYRTVQYFQNKLRLWTVYARFMHGLFLAPIYARFKTGICRILVTSARLPQRMGGRWGRRSRLGLEIRESYIVSYNTFSVRLLFVTIPLQWILTSKYIRKYVSVRFRTVRKLLPCPVSPPSCVAVSSLSNIVYNEPHVHSSACVLFASTSSHT